MKIVAPGAPIVHDEPPRIGQTFADIIVHTEANTNICNHFKLRKGDVEEGFRGSDFVAEHTFTTPTIQHCHLEPHVCIAKHEPSGQITFWSSTQHPYTVRREMARRHVNTPRQSRPREGAEPSGQFANREVGNKTTADRKAVSSRRDVFADLDLHSALGGNGQHLLQAIDRVRAQICLAAVVADLRRYTAYDQDRRAAFNRHPRRARRGRPVLTNHTRHVRLRRKVLSHSSGFGS